jgi:hypothetical protein
VNGIGEGDLVHAKCPSGTFDHNEVYRITSAFCDPNEFEWFVKATLVRPKIAARFAPNVFKFKFDCVKKVSPLVALALCAQTAEE